MKDFLKLLNGVARAARPAHHSLAPIEDLGTKFVDTEVDSLDNMMIVMFMAIIFEISDEVAKDFHPTTPQELLDFVAKNKQREPESFEAAMEMIK